MIRVYLALSFAIVSLLLIFGCSKVEDVSQHDWSETNVAPAPEAVAIVEKYFLALRADQKDVAEALLSKLFVRNAKVSRDEVDLNNLQAVQSKHFDWFTYFKTEAFIMERVAMLSNENGKMRVRAFCTSPAGDSRIPQVVDVHLIVQDGRTVIRDFELNTSESIRQAKMSQSR